MIRSQWPGTVRLLRAASQMRRDHAVAAPGNRTDLIGRRFFMLRRLSFCMFLLAGAAHAAPIDDALRQYDGGQFEVAAGQLAPLAEGGNAVAQERLAVMYFYGRGGYSGTI